MGKKILIVLVIALAGYWVFSSPDDAANLVGDVASMVQDGLASAADFISNL